MTAARDAFVEARLREAAETATWPTTPDLRTSVLARIEGRQGPGVSATDRPSPEALARRRATPARRLALALVVALIALVTVAGLAAALGFRLGGLDIELVPTLRPVATPAPGAGLGLGSAIPLADARALDQPRVRVPAALPPPDVAYVTGTGDQAIVTLAWRADPGRPALAGSDLSLTVMAIPGTTSEPLVSKMVSRGTTVERVTVGGLPGWWISGAPHEILVERPDSDVVVEPAKVAGDTLAFTRDGTTYRLESSLGRERTIAIAESLR